MPRTSFVTWVRGEGEVRLTQSFYQSRPNHPKRGKFRGQSSWSKIPCLTKKRFYRHFFRRVGGPTGFKIKMKYWKASGEVQELSYTSWIQTSTLFNRSHIRLLQGGQRRRIRGRRSSRYQGSKRWFRKHTRFMRMRVWPIITTKVTKKRGQHVSARSGNVWEQKRAQILLPVQQEVQGLGTFGRWICRQQHFIRSNE